jgi:hypothetical protein
MEAVKFMQLESIRQAPRPDMNERLVVRVARREPEKLLDGRASFQEYDGSFVLVAPRGDQLLRQVHAEEEGDRDDPIPAGTWLEDQLPVTLRGIGLKPDWKKEVMLLPSLSASREPVKARIAVEGEERIPTAANARMSFRVVVTFGKDSVTYWFDRDNKLHALLKYQASDGRSGEIKGIMREPWPPEKK